MTIAEHWVTADLAHFPDNDGLRYEIIDGELHVTKAPHLFHQIVASRIVARLDEWATAQNNGAATTTPGVILREDNNLIPDGIWISSERLATALGADGKLYEMPELVIEVLSPGAANARRDRERKLEVYARYGAVEYWIVDWQQRSLEQYRTTDGDMQLVATYGEADTLSSPLLAEFALPLAPLFVGIKSQI